MASLAIQGGPKAVQTSPGDIFRWPIITEEDENAVLEVLRAGSMSGTDVTIQFEREFADWHGVEYALAHNTGTAALHCAMYACGVGRGDEIVCPSLTYWASGLPALSLGGTIVFGEVDPDTLTLDPRDLEKRITPRTKAIVAVHYCGYPCDMDAIMAIAERHGVKVIEDVSHAHGGLYKGRLVGTIGHIGAMSVMAGKSLACGEGGMMLTNDRSLYLRAVAFGHYERHRHLDDPEIQPFAGYPLGGHKYRMHQATSAVGRVQLRHYRDRLAQIQDAMNRFWDLLEGVPGIQAHRPEEASGSTMGGWYTPHGLYRAEDLGGLDIRRFCEAVRAEGASTRPGANELMHLHPMLNEADIYGDGKPTRIAHSNRDLRQPAGSLPVTEASVLRTYSIPWFKHDRPDIIAEHALAFRKVAEHADALLAAPRELAAV